MKVFIVTEDSDSRAIVDGAYSSLDAAVDAIAGSFEGWQGYAGPVEASWTGERVMYFMHPDEDEIVLPVRFTITEREMDAPFSY